MSDPFSSDRQSIERPSHEPGITDSRNGEFGMKMPTVDLPDGGEEPAPPPGRYPRWLSLFYLYFRPKVFFRQFVTSENALIVTLCAFSFGMSGTIDRIDTQAALGKAPEIFMASWPSYWTTVLVLGGAVGGAILYLIGGWWYRVRIGWSGARNPDGDLARRIYVYTAQIVAVPFILVTVWETMQYPHPAASFYADGSAWYFLLLVFPFWAVWISYCGVRQVFRTQLVPSLIWFLILPALLYGTGIVGVFAGVLLQSADEPPNLDYTKNFTSDVFSFSYPGNWWIVDDDWHDPNSYVEIEPPQDALVQLMFYDSEDTLEQEMNFSEDQYYEGQAQVERMEDFGQWGDFVGVGRSYRMNIDGVQLTVRIFIMPVAEGFYFEVQELVNRDVASMLQPGLERIRSSLRLKVGDDGQGGLVFGDQ